MPGLLIDVADYTHLTGGPRVVLVAHEGNYALDDADGRPGLVYTRKQPLDGPLADRLAEAARALFAAAERLERDSADEGDGRAAFLGNEIAVIANDRRAAAAERQRGSRVPRGRGLLGRPPLRRRHGRDPAAGGVGPPRPCPFDAGHTSRSPISSARWSEDLATRPSSPGSNLGSSFTVAPRCG